MPEPMGFTSDVLDRLRTTDEVRIETRAAPSAPPHRTTIWVVVDEGGRVLIRTYQGPNSRWYRELRANPECALWLGREPVPVRAEPANDADRIAAASRGYEAKYAGDPAVRGMVAVAQLPTTLELRPR
ncbi:MAG TPA: nitroreductase/quinone reductase family protein [Candidatus Limnocylindrales bacterium]|nr:nitroreductase/quinone reductase family protein [Candidatus Limnocylindrales bacterium]